MIHSFKYTFLGLFRQKTLLFWTLLFPIILAVMFYVAFSGLEKDEIFSAIPVAVVEAEIDASDVEQTMSQEGFRALIEALSDEEAEEQMLIVQYMSEEEALQALKAKDIVGIIYEGNPVRLSVSSEMSNVTLEQSILESFISQYNSNYEAIRNVIMKNPYKATELTALIEEDVSYMTEVKDREGNQQEQLAYFFNLIAMACMFASSSGLLAATTSQANLSSLGMRKSVAATKKGVTLVGDLLARTAFQTGCVWVGIFFIRYILKIDLGSNMALILLLAFAGCVVGISLGFAVGAIGNMKETTKIGICMGVSMSCCFLSGLMIHNMRIIIGNVAPWFNHINPTALIADGFYSIAVYPSMERYLVNVGSLFVISLILCFFGYMLMRRKSYASV